MKLKPFILALVVPAIVQLAPLSLAQQLDESDVRREARERTEKVSLLSLEDQLKLRSAEQKATEDPAVKAAFEKRNKAIQEFRDALRAGMIKADPTVEAILAKVAISAEPGK
jgi:hypothetical protein